MDIAIVTYDNQGGMLHYASQMANALASDETDVTQIVGAGADTSLFDESVAVEEIAFPASPSDLGPGAVRSLARLYRSLADEFDVIHLTTAYSYTYALLPFLARKPFVYTLHDVYAHSGEYNPNWELLKRLTVSAADRVVVHGEHNAASFAEKYGQAHKCVTIPHGDYSFFRRYADGPVSYDPELLYFGRLKPYKGLDTLLDAERLLDGTNEYELTIAGGGEFDPERVADRPNVTLRHGYVPNEDVAELFRRCRAVVLPYRDATQSGVVPIAYSFEKPVVVTDVGGLPEVVSDGETGYLVPPESPEPLADRCRDLLADRGLAERLGRQGQAFARREMNWDDIADDLLETYRELVGSETTRAKST
ncbi:glycosyltransferase family 4 protein [Halorussus lipolyticus]|uniref:glycosyltransferase family 4 protein n=1 Tax=Halorussus lipolyticus TaxID=3034024 RepID=UPI0023E81D46|nr:glycosyltransferase family 4 protein [Halorussus sp. DT80]